MKSLSFEPARPRGLWGRRVARRSAVQQKRGIINGRTSSQVPFIRRSHIPLPKSCSRRVASHEGERGEEN